MHDRSTRSVSFLFGTFASLDATSRLKACDVFAGLLRIVVTALIPALGSTVHAQDWVEYTSENFRLYSDVRDDFVLELLGDFEEYRLAALTVMGLPDQPESEELKIVYPARAADFRLLSGGADIGGFFYHQEFGPRMIIKTAARSARSRGHYDPVLWNEFAESADRQTLYHEYVHYLMDQRSASNFPPWYREGLAQVLMMAQLNESTVKVGMPIRGVVWQNVDATVEDIIDTDYDGRTYDFYLMAWLLTHYLTVDAADVPERRRQATEYLRRYDEGEDPVEAFTATFGISMDEMQSEMEAYRARPTMKAFQLPRSTYEGEISRRALSDGEELYLLGDLAVELYQSQSALKVFDRFDRRYENSPLRLKVMSRRAVALAHEDELDEGDALVAALLALELDDGDVLADIAHYYHDRFQIHTRWGDAEARANLDLSIRYGELAVMRNPADLEALYYLGRAYGFSGDPQAGSDILLRAFHQAPGVAAINVDLARVLYRIGRAEEATLLVSRTYSASHSEGSRDRYGELLEQMRNGNVDPAFLDPYASAD